MCFLLSVVPGGREVFEKVIRVAPPSNFYPSQLALAGGFALFHGHRLRRITGGQLPVVIFIIFFIIFLSLILSALSEVTSTWEKSGKIWDRKDDHEMCVKLGEK